MADEAGVSIGLLQHYFRTRKQLGREAFTYVCEARAGRIAKASADAATSWERIEIYLREGLEWRDLYDRSRMWVDLVAAGARDPVLRQETANSLDIWRAPLLNAIEDGVAAGELQPVVSIEAAVDALIALIDGTEVRVVVDDIENPEIGQRTAKTAIIIARHLLGAAA